MHIQTRFNSPLRDILIETCSFHIYALLNDWREAINRAPFALSNRSKEAMRAAYFVDERGMPN
jgi:hypothetical protein